MAKIAKLKIFSKPVYQKLLVFCLFFGVFILACPALAEGAPVVEPEQKASLLS